MKSNSSNRQVLKHSSDSPTVKPVANETKQVRPPVKPKETKRRDS